MFQRRHVRGEVGIVLIADINAAGRQRELTIEIQVAGAADFDAPDNGFRESGILDFGDVVGRVLIKRAAAKDPRISGLSRRRLPQERQ